MRRPYSAQGIFGMKMPSTKFFCQDNFRKYCQSASAEDPYSIKNAIFITWKKRMP